MITIDQVIAVAEAYLATDRRGAAHGITKNEGAIPIYRPNDRRPAICDLATRDRTVGEVCRRFYRDLPLDADSTECPFGIALHYQRIRISDKRLCLYQQFGFEPNRETAREFPRISKKAAVDALDNRQEFDVVSCRDKFEQAKSLLSTLLTGRVAESIRALSHHLLTPLQGAMADACGFRKF